MSNEWYRIHGEGATEAPLPEYNFDEIYQAYIYLVREEHMWNEFFRVNQLNPLRVWYEDFQNDLHALRPTVQHLLDNAAAALGTAPARGARIVTGNVPQRDAASYQARAWFVSDLVDMFTSGIPPVKTRKRQGK